MWEERQFYINKKEKAKTVFMHVRAWSWLMITSKVWPTF